MKDMHIEKMPILYVLTHEYSDRSGFSICGITADYDVAIAWYRANDEANVYQIDYGQVNHWMSGSIGWRVHDRAEMIAPKKEN